MADPPGWGPSGCSSWDSVVGRSNPPYLNGICRYHRNDGTNRSFLFLYQQRTLAWPILLLSPCVRHPPLPPSVSSAGRWDLGFDHTLTRSFPTWHVWQRACSAVWRRYRHGNVFHQICNLSSSVNVRFHALSGFYVYRNIDTYDRKQRVRLLKVWEDHEQWWSGSGGGQSPHVAIVH